MHQIVKIHLADEYRNLNGPGLAWILSAWHVVSFRGSEPCPQGPQDGCGSATLRKPVENPRDAGELASTIAILVQTQVRTDSGFQLALRY